MNENITNKNILYASTKNVTNENVNFLPNKIYVLLSLVKETNKEKIVIYIRIFYLNLSPKGKISE